MVERDDAPDHATRLAHREVDNIGAHRDRGALHLGDEAREELDLRRRDLRVGEHLLDRIAAIGGIDHGEFAGVLAQDLRDPLEDARALQRRHAPPFAERGFGRRDRGIHVGRAAIRDLAERFTGAGIDGVGVAAVLRRMPLAAVIGVAMLGQGDLGRNRRLRRGHGVHGVVSRVECGVGCLGPSLAPFRRILTRGRGQRQG
jgi:hypothetical protein